MEAEKNPCKGCPRDILFQKVIENIETTRECHKEGAQQMLDENNLRELAKKLHRVGAIEDPDDLDGLRANITMVFEYLDIVEAENREQRSNEERLCIGALRMRATSGSTKYDVTLCRLPGHGRPNNTEIARVERTDS